MKKTFLKVADALRPMHIPIGFIWFVWLLFLSTNIEMAVKYQMETNIAAAVILFVFMLELVAKYFRGNPDA